MYVYMYMYIYIYTHIYIYICICIYIYIYICVCACVCICAYVDVPRFLFLERLQLRNGCFFVWSWLPIVDEDDLHLTGL